MSDDRTFVVETPAQLKALADPLRQRLLQALAVPGTAKAAAERLGEPLTKLYHHLDQLLDAGLIVVVGEERRRAVLERTFATAARRIAVSPAAFGAKAGPAGRGHMLRTLVDEVLEAGDPAEGSARVMRASARLGPAALETLEREFAALVARLESDDASPVDLLLLSSRQP